MTAKEPKTNANTDETTELAKERTAQAADRTQMAWIRTCLTLIGFGVGIDVLVEGLEQAPTLALQGDRIGSIAALGMGEGTCAHQHTCEQCCKE